MGEVVQVVHTVQQRYLKTKSSRSANLASQHTCAIGVGAAQERQGGPDRAVQVDDEPLEPGVDVGAVRAALVIVLPHVALRRRLRAAVSAGN